MRETSFKRAAKVSLSIRKSDANALRDTLVKSIKPMVEYLASELVQLAMRRLSGEVDRMGEAFEVAISAYASASEPETSYGPSDVLGVGAAVHPGKPAPFDGPPLSPPKSCGKHACADHAQCLARTKLCGCEECLASLRSVYRGCNPDLIEQALGRELAQLLNAVSSNDVRGGGSLPSPRLPVPEPAVAAEQGSTSSDLRKDGRRKGVSTCTKCGQVGGNARGCGKPTGHPTREPDLGDQVNVVIEKIIDTHYPDGLLPSRDLPALSRKFKDAGFTTLAVPPPPVRAPQAQPRLETNAERRARIAARASAVKAAEDKPVAQAGDEGPLARAGEDEFADEIQDAEARKLGGELPVPRSSWGF